MADGRRTRWVAHDVYFLDDGLGAAMFDRFGAAGVALWHGFIAACKKNHVEGETTFASDIEALNTFGLPGLTLVDNDGEEFKLDDWLQLLSSHKVIRRSRRGRRIKVTCTRWDRWQIAAKRSRDADKKAADRAAIGAEQEADRTFSGDSQVPDRASTGPHHADGTATPGEQSPRSDQEKTSPPRGQQTDDASPDTDLDLDTDRDRERTPQPPSPARPEEPTPLPDTWSPTDAHATYAKAHHLDLEAETRKYRARRRSEGRTSADWNADFHGWLQRGVEYAARNATTPASQPPDYEPSCIRLEICTPGNHKLAWPCAVRLDEAEVG